MADLLYMSENNLIADVLSILCKPAPNSITFYNIVLTRILYDVINNIHNWYLVTFLFLFMGVCV